MTLGTTGTLLVAAFGREGSGDDALGPRVARTLAAGGWDGLREASPVVRVAEDPSQLVTWLEDARAAVLVDALRAPQPCGTLVRLEIGRTPLPRPSGRASSHGVGLADALELARTLGVLPPRTVLLGLVGARFEMGSPLTPAVEAALPALIGAVRREVAQLMRRPPRRAGGAPPAAGTAASA